MTIEICFLTVNSYDGHIWFNYYLLMVLGSNIIRRAIKLFRGVHRESEEYSWGRKKKLHNSKQRNRIGRRQRRHSQYILYYSCKT